MSLAQHISDCFKECNAYRSALREIYEEYAGMEVFESRTALEAYQQQIIERMAEIAREALEE